MLEFFSFFHRSLLSSSQQSGLVLGFWVHSFKILNKTMPIPDCFLYPKRWVAITRVLCCTNLFLQSGYSSGWLIAPCTFRGPRLGNVSLASRREDKQADHLTSVVFTAQKVMICRGSFKQLDGDLHLSLHPVQDALQAALHDPLLIVVSVVDILFPV